MAKKSIRPIRIEGNIAFVPLTKGYEVIIDVDDVPLVEMFNWQALIDKLTVYAMRRSSADENGNRQAILMHRAIMSAPPKIQVDHIDSNGLNNRKSTNLRLATTAQNQHNQRIARHNRSGFKGVSWDCSAEKWRAMIMLNGKLKYLGRFTELNAAAAAYAAASAEMHGEFGRTT